MTSKSCEVVFWGHNSRLTEDLPKDLGVGRLFLTKSKSVYCSCRILWKHMYSFVTAQETIITTLNNYFILEITYGPKTRIAFCPAINFILLDLFKKFI